MPNSLKCKIKHLCHNRTITESERDRILKALEQETFINKPCVSSGVCEHDKNNVLEEIREEIKELRNFYFVNFQGYSMSVAQQCLDIIDKHIRKESEWIQEQK